MKVNSCEFVWLCLTYWLSKKWGYYGEYHLRRADFLDRMSKLYLRFGANYKVDQQLRITVGVVNRYTWTDHPGSPEEEDYVPEFRFWEQLLFKNRYFGMKLYHTSGIPVNDGHSFMILRI